MPLTVHNATAAACVSPAGAAGIVDLQIALNGADFGSATPFAYYAPPIVRDTAPDGGARRKSCTLRKTRA